MKMLEVLKNRVNCGLILKTSLDEFQGIKEMILREYPTVSIIYQCSDVASLWIVRKTDREMKNDEN